MSTFEGRLNFSSKRLDRKVSGSLLKGKRLCKKINLNVYHEIIDCHVRQMHCKDPFVAQQPEMKRTRHVIWANSLSLPLTSALLHLLLSWRIINKRTSIFFLFMIYLFLKSLIIWVACNLHIFNCCTSRLIRLTSIFYCVQNEMRL